jgi:hypothetical protein
MHTTRLLPVALTAALALAIAGCGLTDPTITTTESKPAATAAVTTVAVSGPDDEAAVRRFANAYVGLLNSGGEPAEAALRRAAAPKLAAGLILATTDAQVAGDKAVSASSRVEGVVRASGPNWRVHFATGSSTWDMLVALAPNATGTPVVTRAVTQPASDA